jgi:hypothetical protein
VLNLDYDGSTPLTPFIQAASAVVDDVSVLASQKSYTQSAVKLELVERWLAAHLYCVQDPTYMSKNTADSSASFARKLGEGNFETTPYGQTAVAMDLSGSLSAIGRRQFANATWLGKPPSQQIPYDQRN